MDSIKITGGKPLNGKINISGSKNACLPIMAASILTSEPLELDNVPKLSDIGTMKQLLLNLGASINSNEKGESLTLTIDCSEIDNLTAPYDIVRKMRASIWSLGPLLARFGKARVSLPGGCAIGARLVDLHIDVLKALGAEIDISEGYINAAIPGFDKDSSKRLKGTEFTFAKKSVGATINAIMAASLAEGTSKFQNCAFEPEISDLCNCLVHMGAEIEGIGTDSVIVRGVSELHGCSYSIIPDRIEAGTYMIAACITKGNLTLQGIRPELVANVTEPLKAAGASIAEEDDTIVISAKNGINPVNIATAPYPGFATDLQAQFMSLMTLSSGTSEISENIFENRFMHVPELARMGANISIKGNKAVINGVDSLKGAEVMASDLRASVSLILAGLAAKGETIVRRVYHLDRGYQDLEKKLSACGAEITRIQQ